MHIITRYNCCCTFKHIIKATVCRIPMSFATSQHHPFILEWKVDGSCKDLEQKWICDPISILFVFWASWRSHLWPGALLEVFITSLCLSRAAHFVGGTLDLQGGVPYVMEHASGKRCSLGYRKWAVSHSPVSCLSCRGNHLHFELAPIFPWAFIYLYICFAFYLA